MSRNGLSEKVASWERFISTVASAIMVGILFWVGTSLSQVKEDVAIMKVQLPQLASLQEKVIEISERVALVENELYRMEGESHAAKVR